MTKKLNKNTPNSDELLKRLESNDSGGLDDFEKEALEGFASLENPALAKSLNNKLNAQIDEVYFEKKSGKGTFFYLSMAAGLVIVVGLSVLFYTFFTNGKQELALNNENDKTEQLPGQPSPALESNEPNNAAPEEESSKENPASGSSHDLKQETENETRRENQMVSTKSTANKNEQSTDDAKASDKDQLTRNNREESNAPAPVTALAEEQKEVFKAEKVSEKEAPSKPSEDKGLADAKPRSTVPIGGPKKKAAIGESDSRKERSKSEGEALATEDKTEDNLAKVNNVPASQAAGAGLISGKKDESSVLAQPVFINKNYSKAQDYIKSEIDKNATLKNNVKEFKAKLTINENGKVSKVKFLTDLSNCNNCEKELENILLNMPNWQAATQEGKKVKESIHFVYP